ncbi:MAG: ComF family protein [Ktedonobacteraceae bacterium]|nr:ComF family protein [Ktedonobacteraceae bacterium]
MYLKQLLRDTRETLHSFLDLLFPPRCAACKRTGALLCAACISAMPLLNSPFCPRCAGPLSSPLGCVSCLSHPLLLNGLRAYGPYCNPLRSCIHALKYHGYTRLARPLGHLLALAYRRYAMQADLITPVPLHQERLRRRGYNQAQLLAEVCAAELNLPLQPLLVRTRATPPQVHLNISERRRNVAGAFYRLPSLSPETISGRRILLIDDVCTTGATLGACAAPLFAAGASAVWGLVLARPALSTKRVGQR